MPLTKIKSLGITDGTIVGDDINSTFNLTGKTVTLPAGTGGKVLQVVSATNNTNTSSSSSTYADTGLTASITPSSTSSKVLVLVFHNGCGKSSNDTALQLKLLRASTDLVQFEKFAGATSSGSQNNFGTVGISYLDSPSTTSSVTICLPLPNFNANPALTVVKFQVSVDLGFCPKYG